MDGVSRLNPVRAIDVFGWLTTIRFRKLPAESAAARLFAQLEPYRVGQRLPALRTTCGYRMESVSFRLRPHVSDTGAVVISALCAGRPGGGEGSAALQAICRAADGADAVLVLDARPYATEAVAEPMRRADLVAWYRRFGFRPTGRSGMQRDPAGRPFAARP